MSGHGFHVHDPHDHAVEHATHGDDAPLIAERRKCLFMASALQAG